MAPRRGEKADVQKVSTPKPAAKRGRAAAASTEPAAADATAAATPAKAAKKAAPAPAKAIKRDKSTPLSRSNTPRELAPESGRVLRLLSVNVAGLRAVLAGDRKEALRALVERERPDVFCLNEHKLKEDDVASCEASLRELLPKEYTMHWSVSTAKKGYSGVAVFLRQSSTPEDAAIVDAAAISVTPGMGPGHKKDPIISEEGRILTVDLPEVTVVSTYVPNSGTDLQRLEYRVNRDAERCWDRALAEYVRGLQAEKKKPVVVIGDLNCCHDVRDMWNMHDRPDFPEGLAVKPLAEQYTGLSALKKAAGLTPQERESFGALLKSAGLVDSFRALHPGAVGAFSYFSQRFPQNRPMNQGLRLDYVLASKELCDHFGSSPDGAATETAPRILDSFILDSDDLIADHAAVGCHLLLPGL